MEKAGDDFDTKKMLADYMENGLLENIIDMYKHDSGLYAYIGDLLTDERLRVRIGGIALLETLAAEDAGHVKKAIPVLLPLLKDKEAVTRGDAAYALGVIGDTSATHVLEEMKNDEDANVRMIAGEAVEDIIRRFS